MNEQTHTHTRTHITSIQALPVHIVRKEKTLFYMFMNNKQDKTRYKDNKNNKGNSNYKS